MFPDVYISTGVELTHYHWCRAAALYAGEGAVIGGRSAAYLWAVEQQSDDLDLVELIVPRHRRVRTPGLAVTRCHLEQSDVRSRRGVPVTSAMRTTFDLVRTLPRTDAVIAADAMLRRTTVGIPDLRRYAASHSGLRGVRQACERIELLEPLTESPMESVCRLVLLDGGLPRPTAQHVVIHRGRHLARLDFAYPELMIGIEYEGDHHRSRETFRRDIARYRALEDMGWFIVRATADDVLRDPDLLVARIHRLIRERSHRPSARPATGDRRPATGDRRDSGR